MDIDQTVKVLVSITAARILILMYLHQVNAGPVIADISTDTDSFNL